MHKKINISMCCVFYYIENYKVQHDKEKQFLSICYQSLLSIVIISYFYRNLNYNIMNTNVKYEVVQLLIAPKSRKKEKIEEAKNMTWEKLLCLHNYTEFRQFLADKIDKDNYLEDKTAARAFSAHNKNTDIEKSIKPGSISDCTVGFINGGIYGRKRQLAELSNKLNKSEIGEKQVVGDDFHFLFYFPKDIRFGILVFQSFNDSNLRPSFVKKIKEFLETDDYKIIDKHFLPTFYKEQLENGYSVRNVVFNDILKLKEGFERGVDNDEQEYVIEVRVKPIKETPIKGLEKLKDWVSGFKNLRIGDKELNDFKKSEVNLSNDGPIKSGKLGLDFSDNTLKPKPVIYCEDIIANESGDFDLKLIEERAYEILEYAKMDINNM